MNEHEVCKTETVWQGFLTWEAIYGIPSGTQRLAPKMNQQVPSTVCQSALSGGEDPSGAHFGV